MRVQGLRYSKEKNTQKALLEYIILIYSKTHSLQRLMEFFIAIMHQKFLIIETYRNFFIKYINFVILYSYQHKINSQYPLIPFIKVCYNYLTVYIFTRSCEEWHKGPKYFFVSVNLLYQGLYKMSFAVHAHKYKTKTSC